MACRNLYVLRSPHSTEVADIVRRAVPEHLKANVPNAVSATLAPAVMGQPPPLPILYDASPSVSILGLNYRSVEEMVVTATQSVLENGFDTSEKYLVHKLA
jgi:hypothetical protein